MSSTVVTFTQVKRIISLIIATMALSLVACNLALKIKDGDMAYRLKHYGLAAELYTAEYEDTTDPQVKAYKASMASKSYTQVNDLENAYKWIVNRMTIDKSLDDLPQLGTLALSQNELSLATRVYEQLYKATNNLNYSRQLSYIKGLSILRQQRAQQRSMRLTVRCTSLGVLP